MSALPDALGEGSPSGRSLIDVAARVATRLAARGPLDGSYLMEGVAESLAGLVAEAEPLVAEETGFEASSPAAARVLGRAEWAAANVDSILTLMAPLLEKAEHRMAEAPFGGFARRAYRPALGAQLGAALGFLSHKVLGQYDVLVGRTDEVWFVGPNIVLLERRLGFVPRDFRLWVALHELTHRAQFEGNPWLRPHFLTSVHELLASLEMDARTLVERALEAARHPEDPTPIGVRMLAPDQREQFDRLQALMTVVEGHGNFVMDRVAARVIPTQARMRRTLRAQAAAAGPVAKLIQRLLGLDLKRRQYEEGQAFFEAVDRAAGKQGVAACFGSPERLPAPDEIASPERWIQRVLH